MKVEFAGTIDEIIMEINRFLGEMDLYITNPPLDEEPTIEEMAADAAPEPVAESEPVPAEEKPARTKAKKAKPALEVVEDKASDPAADKKKATKILMGWFNAEDDNGAGRAMVTKIMKEFKIKRFGDLDESRGTELLDRVEKEL